MRLVGFAMRAGYTAMCSDFSLKSLIHEWSEEVLGPNPFVKVGECSDSFCLEFDPAALQDDEVPQQLQVVGELCAAQGKAVVSALGGTIVYTVDPKRRPTEAYELKVLTVVTDHAEVSRQSWSPDMLCSTGSGDSERRGLAGHVSLTYKEGGGQLITSNGHWIELTRVDVTQDSVQRVAAKHFGAAEVGSFEDEINGLSSETERAECTQKRAHKLIKQSVATRMKSRTKYSPHEL